MWVEPKTNWTVQPYVNGRYNGDWFNIADYNRITGNILELYAVLRDLKPVAAMVNMPEQDVSGFPSASVFNAIESNLYQLVLAYGKIPGYQTKTWVGGGAAPAFSDLNRWESTTLEIYQWSTTVAPVIPSIEFTLGGVQF